ncbi:MULTISPECIES: hypothetical protein [unclassified Neisseria]|nr:MULTISPECIES: hypothetical protein [unclassified Neisseria]
MKNVADVVVIFLAACFIFADWYIISKFLTLPFAFRMAEGC